MADLKRVIFTGGGTGGHLFPGIAVAEEVRKQHPDCQILFVGSERGIEKRIIKESGFEHRAIPMLPSSALKRTPWKFLQCFRESKRLAGQIMRKFNPQIVVGLGGFASLPVVRNAQKSRCPTVLLEQNIVLGRATRWLMKRADCVCHSFEQSIRFGRPSETQVFTGNPVRREVIAYAGHPRPAQSARGKTILILGGSQGAYAVNQMWFQVARAMKSELGSCRIIHQTGESDCQAARQFYEELGLSAISEPYFEILPTLYQQSDFVVSRAGATTLAELSCFGLPVILIPYPGSIGDHQVKNARYFSERDGACLIEQSHDLSVPSEDLIQAVESLISSNLTDMQQAMKKLATPQAATAVLDRMLQFANTAG